MQSAADRRRIGRQRRYGERAADPVLRLALAGAVGRALGELDGVLAKHAAHPAEEVGRKLRGMMPWITAKRLVDSARN